MYVQLHLTDNNVGLHPFYDILKMIKRIMLLILSIYTCSIHLNATPVAFT